MRRLPPDHQAVLSLRYLDDLTVPEVAAALGRSVHATESLLARAPRVSARATWSRTMADWFETRFREPVDTGDLDPAFVARMRALVVEEWQADAETTPPEFTDTDRGEGDVIMLETEAHPRNPEPRPPAVARPAAGSWWPPRSRWSPSWARCSSPSATMTSSRCTPPRPPRPHRSTRAAHSLRRRSARSSARPSPARSRRRILQFRAILPSVHFEYLPASACIPASRSGADGDPSWRPSRGSESMPIQSW